MVRFPRFCPLSLLKGATPASAATCWRFSVPSSGSRASNVAEKRGPTPFLDRSRRCLALHCFLDLMDVLISLSISWICFERKSIVAWMLGRITLGAIWMRASSAVRASTSCRRRITKAWSVRVGSSGKPRSSGRLASAKRAIISASMRSVFASLLHYLVYSDDNDSRHGPTLSDRDPHRSLPHHGSRRCVRDRRPHTGAAGARDFL